MPETHAAEEPTRPALYVAAERLAAVEALDQPAQRIAATVREAIGSGTLKDLLSGTWLGHALHPLLTDVPIGSFTSATVLDLVGGRDSEKAADLLVGLGVAASVPTIVSGWSDWADTTANASVRRVGVVHAAANATGVLCYAASLVARGRGRRGRGRLLGLAGAGALGAGGYLGGHLSYSKGVGVDQTAFEAGPEDWTPALDASELSGERPVRTRVGTAEVMLLRQNGRIVALSARCTHRGAPLEEGTIEDGCVTCPWHGSVFRLDDGSVVRGPASAPQPAFDVRERDGKVELRARAGAPA